MISVSALSVAYGEMRVVRDVTLSIPRGGMVALVGPNGAGKSTLLSVMSRLISPTSGQVSLDGRPLAETPSDALARSLAILRQDNNLTTRLTVGDLIAFGRFPHSRGRLGREDRDHINRALAAMDLLDLRNRFLDELSGGQRQRAFIAMVLCQDTDYILLDEPLNNLDMKHAVSMMKTFRRLVDEMGKTVVVVLHDINFASCYADRIIAMRDGQVVEDGPPTLLISEPKITDIYGLSVQVQVIDDQRIVVYYR